MGKFVPSQGYGLKAEEQGVNESCESGMTSECALGEATRKEIGNILVKQYKMLTDWNIANIDKQPEQVLKNLDAMIKQLYDLRLYQII